ncbi:receptor-like protein 9DC1 [Solanum stenotomum]|uniref:receptor-like protein 9DC1 n=1 Tax=Solanum stenotomum TaxID=172797 RepID=UPI0020D17141|nr:receptor-like protein 9DC1 [Solanum stenotomum]
MELYLSSVNATGKIPESFCHLTSLRTLDLSYCNLSGSIPKPLWNLTNIDYLVLAYNHLEGPISDFFRFRKLSLLSLRNNNFDGQLEYLSFNRSWTQLEMLDFLSNSLTGPIPSNEFKSKTLNKVFLKQNQLQGPISKSLLEQQLLQYLLLSHNNINGQIASTVCNLKILQVLDLGNNNLEGTIPLCLGEMSELSVLDLSNNGLSGTINTTFIIGNPLEVIKLQGNKLEGKVPQSLINCKYFIVLGLGNNELSDTFPKWLGALPYLQILNLRSNKFYGSIKDSRTDNLSHTSITAPVICDLSSNKISGEIPQQLASLTSLEVLNLSHNYLVGCIPKGKQFDTFENSSYQGNDGLRGLPLSKDCGGDEGVPQADEGEEGDSAIISWKAVLMGYGCGLVIGLSIIYIMLSTQYPAWFSRMDVELEHKILTRMKKHKKRQ